MKDGTTHLAYKPEHAVDLDTRSDRDGGQGEDGGARCPVVKHETF